MPVHGTSTGYQPGSVSGRVARLQRQTMPRSSGGPTPESRRTDIWARSWSGVTAGFRRELVGQAVTSSSPGTRPASTGEPATRRRATPPSSPASCTRTRPRHGPGRTSRGSGPMRSRPVSRPSRLRSSSGTRGSRTAATSRTGHSPAVDTRGRHGRLRRPIRGAAGPLCLRQPPGRARTRARWQRDRDPARAPTGLAAPRRRRGRHSAPERTGRLGRARWVGLLRHVRPDAGRPGIRPRESGRDRGLRPCVPRVDDL